MRENVLVSIVSDQTLPNILIIKELEQINFKLFIFISTEEMERRGKTDTIVSTSKIDSRRVKVVKVDQDNYLEILNKLNSIEEIKDKNIFYYLNITCGTKPMSITLLDFYRDYENKIVIYIPVGKNYYIDFYSGKKIDISYRVTVEEYLSSYNIKIENKKKIPQHIDCLNDRKEMTYKLWDFALNNIDKVNEIIKNLRDTYKNNRNKISRDEIKDIAGELLNLINLDLESESHDRVKNWYNYFTGGWFEELVYLRTRDILGVKENDHIVIGIQIVKGGVKNELDVVVCLENRLYYIECKTGLGEKQNDVFKETFEKLARMKDQKQFGLSMRNYLLTLDKKVLYDVNGDLQKEERESTYGIKFYGLKEIEEAGLDGIIKEIFGIKGD
ncbi:Card1-like endonuclease domain-containing protein [Calditerrivibrio nitroreducens]|uniref:DUF1887 domain-containing protein n=1 Tax=Calditerrivibrio nitroreducens (strain DSM 19672 / NBRC 101217 / Yu37-1) TaxID=768670 RepID=E4TFE9_CALNY|nr:DUF1887 family CARF protein [Calditerrivibrio nitroreducens]ADR19522.1 hypothetical protein Calni_1614 [Calditerrivibrio nitroreducens DSM 19672]